MHARTLALSGAVLAGLMASTALASSEGNDPAKIEKGTYVADPSHTAVAARIDHLGLSKTVIRFTKTAGQFTYDPAHPEASALDVTIDTASLNSDFEARDADLRKGGFFNVAAFPTAHYVGTSLVRVDATHARVNGQLTLLGVTKPVTLDVTLVGEGAGLANDRRVGVVGHMVFNRSDFGMKTFLPMVGDAVDVSIDAEFSKKKD